MGNRFKQPEFVVVKRNYAWQTRRECFCSPALIPTDRSPCGCDVFSIERQTPYVLCLPAVRRSWRQLDLHFEQAGRSEGDKPVVVLNRRHSVTSRGSPTALDNFGDVAKFEGYFEEVEIEFSWAVRPDNSLYRLHVRDSVAERVTQHRLVFKIL
jgi:hypothetical protein